MRLAARAKVVVIKTAPSSLGKRGCLPSVDVWLPLAILVQVSAKNVGRAGGRFLGRVMQVHVRFFGVPSAFAVITSGAGRHHVCPDMLASQVSGSDVIHRQVAILPTAVLAGIIVPSKDLAASQLDARPRSADHILEADDRRPWKNL